MAFFLPMSVAPRPPLVRPPTCQQGSMRTTRRPLRRETLQTGCASCFEAESVRLSRARRSLTFSPLPDQPRMVRFWPLTSLDRVGFRWAESPTRKSRSRSRRSLVLFATLAIGAACLPANAEAPRQPNILVLRDDDIGQFNVGPCAAEVVLHANRFEDVATPLLVAPQCLSLPDRALSMRRDAD